MDVACRAVETHAPLWQQDPRGRFEARACHYARWRPDYPPAALAVLREGLGSPEHLVAVDLGAGTGISTRWLADPFGQVLAVEPNQAMREAAEPHPRVSWTAGSAEATGLPDAVADVVCCAQSFHWFEPRSALAEVRRILRPPGRLVLLWNERDPDDALTGGYSAVVAEASCHHPAAGGSFDAAAVPWDDCGFEAPERFSFRHEQVLTEEGLVGRALSASYVPREGPACDAMRHALRTLHARHKDEEGHVRLVYRTVLWRTHLRPPP